MKNINDYIHVFENSLSNELCDEIINEYEDDDWKKGTLGDYNIDLNIRTCDSIYISKPDIIEKNKKSRREIDNLIFQSVSKNLFEYINIYSEGKTNIQSDSGYSLLRYREGEYIGEHIDSSSRSPRELSCSITLNDNYTGGEFSFFKGELKYKLNKGDMLMFPSNFMYPHEVLPILSGTRYSIITWIA